MKELIKTARRLECYILVCSLVEGFAGVISPGFTILVNGGIRRGGGEETLGKIVKNPDNSLN